MNLSPREKDVLGLLGRGMMDKQIAYALGIAEGTVKSHLRNIRLQVGPVSRVRLALMQHGIDV